jgi:site-specific DNA-cytosine methylase
MSPHKNLILARDEQIIRHAHLFCGVGVGARGFNLAAPRVGNIRGRFECVGGIDVDVGAIRNFKSMTGATGTVLDLFDREQFMHFHGKEPPAGWSEATPNDICAAFGHDTPDVIFLSAPCKGFSGLLSATQSKTDKYQALNGLTLRGIWLTLEAYKHNPVPIILFENVPRIQTRGRWLLDQIIALLRAYGYSVNEDTHDCGVIGGLAQSRKRFLLIARHPAKIPPFIYQPQHHRLRGVGEVIGKLPLPGDPIAGSMHRVPSLQWKTWVRLAFVPAGKDWRVLNDLAVENGVLRDFGILPDQALRDNCLGVCAWVDSAPLLTGQRSPGQGRFSVADPRIQTDREGSGRLGVRDWEEPAGTVQGASRPENGAFSVADPRPPEDANQSYQQYGVNEWSESVGTVSGQSLPGGGAHSVADPRLPGKPRFNNTFRIVPFDAASPAVAGPGDPAGGLAVPDPRPEGSDGYTSTKYKVCRMDGQARAVIGASTTGDGAFAVADPRASFDAQREHYQTGGHYGVVSWQQTGYSVSGSACHDNGFNSVADPRLISGASDEVEKIKLPAPEDRLVCRIISTDQTWHRPFTTLDLAALQSLFDPEEAFGYEGGLWFARTGFDLDAKSDVTKREWIGNAVPGAAATGMAETIGETIILARIGETVLLSPREIWVKPAALALAIDNDQAAFWIDRPVV